MSEVAEQVKPEAVTALIAKYGNAEKALGIQAVQGAKYRQRIRDLTKELEDAQKGVPAQGAVVLTGDDAKRWEAFQALKKSPEEITTALTEAETAKGELAGVKWRESATKAAELAGFDPKAFAVLPGVKDLTIEIRTEKVDGKDEEVPYIKPANGEAKRLNKEFAESRDDWKPLLPALLTSEEQPTRPTGQRWTTERVEGRKSGKVTEEDAFKSAEKTVAYRI